jgi:hypothetical protein
MTNCSHLSGHHGGCEKKCKERCEKKLDPSFHEKKAKMHMDVAKCLKANPTNKEDCLKGMKKHKPSKCSHKKDDKA